MATQPDNPGADAPLRPSLATGVRRLVHNLRVWLARGLMAVRNTKRTRSYYAKALYCRGDLTKRVAGVYGRFYVTDSGDFDHLTGPFFEFEQLTAFLELLETNDVLYEIGGHIGTWTVFMGKKVSRGCIHVFEPEPGNNACLTRNIRLNNLNHVSVHQLAISDKNGHAQFGVNPSQGDGRHSLIHRDIHKHSVEVETLRLDDAPSHLGVPSPTVLKIDCEGAEHFVLKGMTGLLESSGLRMVFIEAHNAQLAQIGSTPKQVNQVLEDSGFKPIHQWKRGLEVITIFKR